MATQELARMVQGFVLACPRADKFVLVWAGQNGGRGRVSWRWGGCVLGQGVG